MTLRTDLTERLAAAFEAELGERVDPALRPSQHADFQADAAMRLARAASRRPRELAEAVLDRASLSDLCAGAEVSGPGFINLTVADGVLAERTRIMASDERLGVAEEAPEVVVIDYSAPNIAKEMHVGHLRSTIIGDAAARLLEWLGHDVRRQNHVGDWGTPFGMLIESVLGTHGADVEDADAATLNEWYRSARARFDDDADFRARARERVVRLQARDADSMRIWRRLVEISQEHFRAIYAQLDVTLRDEHVLGESSYQDDLQPTIDELAEAGLLEESEGALCVFLDEYSGPDGRRTPLILRKSDGGFGYATTDLAAIRRRVKVLGASRLLYVVGLPQSQHLAMVFEVARRAGWLDGVTPEHIGFGSVLGRDGKMLRSRAGSVVTLAELLSDAVARAAELIAEKAPALDGEARDRLARAIGIGAVKYADLSTDRTKDYVFDPARMVALDGDTAPYLQYAHARIRSMLAQASADAGVAGEVTFEQPIERRLALALLHFGDVVTDVRDSLEFHRLTGYLHGLATTFSAFYQQCPVLAAPPGLRASRLTLCTLTDRVLVQGLAFLGIAAPDRL